MDFCGITPPAETTCRPPAHGSRLQQEALPAPSRCAPLHGRVERRGRRAGASRSAPPPPRCRASRGAGRRAARARPAGRSRDALPGEKEQPAPRAAPITVRSSTPQDSCRRSGDSISSTWKPPRPRRRNPPRKPNPADCQPPGRVARILQPGEYMSTNVIMTLSAPGRSDSRCGRPSPFRSGDARPR